MPIYNINKNANLEIEHDIIRYRTPLIEFPTDDINEIERDIKRKVAQINEDPHYLTPFKVDIINSSVVYYYNAKNLKSFFYLRGFRFEEKLKYYSSLVKIGKNTDVNVIWDKFNFVVDDYEENIKAVVYETDLLKIHENKKTLDGIKELILISLTTLDSIVGKPRKVNFIDQDDEIINFAETILMKIDNLDDLDDYIETTMIQYQYEKKNKKDTEEPKEKKTFLSNLLKSKPQTKTTRPARSTGQKNKNSKFTKKEMILYGGLGLLVVIGIILNTIPMDGNTNKEASTFEENKTELVDDNQIDDNQIDNNPTDNKNNESESVKNSVDVHDIDASEHDEQLLLAYRHFLSGDTEKSIQILESIGYEKLSSLDQTIMLNIYEENKMYEKILALEESRAEMIVNRLIGENNLQAIRDLKENLEIENPYIEFEIAYLDGNYEKIIELKDKVNLNGRKEKQIVEAYIGLNNLDEAEKFAKQTGNPDLVQMVKTIR